MLDTIGVAAMLPLMTLLTTGDTQSGFVGAVSEAVGTSEVSTLVVVLAGLVAVCFVAKSVTSILFRWWLLGHTAVLTAEASVELMRRYVLSSYGSHKKRNLADVYRNIGVAVSQTFNQVGLGLLSLLSDALVLLMLALVLLIASPLATLFAVVFFSVATWSIQAILKQRQIRAGKQYVDADGEAWAAIMPGLDGFRESRLTSSGHRFVKAFGHARESQAQAQRRTTMLSELPRYTLEVSFILAVIGMAVILFATGTPENALAVLGVFAAASLRLLPTLNRVTATIGTVRAGQGAMHTLVEEVEKLDEEERHSEARKTDHKFRGPITISGVTYRYPDSERAVLDGVSLTVQEGKTTAIVGASGAGKSTLLDIILGLIPPTRGDVRCGGRSIHDDLVAWFESVGLVPQDVYMVDDTLENNIAYGVDPADIDRERVAQVVEQARLTGFVADLPDGLQTRLGQRGVRLSGGQRQRVGIARALYRRPQILILDEATSALDNVTEHQITETVAGLRGDMTIIVVAHRLSTVRDADTIVFMKDGAVESTGTFSQLRQSNADFERLVELGSLG
ncbi:ABC transporter ATP-binding protein [Pseudoclavibacter helvolus]|uniref:ABC transporter ATP-binding protein n=1 Tax=Pseudoclavibacter helvolus TaxID=255205 RepID=UPI003C711F50